MITLKNLYAARLSNAASYSTPVNQLLYTYILVSTLV